MPTIEEIRQKYPQYGDMSDLALADAMHGKFYADMPREEFNKKIGLTTEPPKEDRSVLGDIVKSFPRGFLGGLAAAASAGGRAAVLEMGQQDTMTDMPSQEQVRGAIEQNVTGQLPKPTGRAGKYSEAAGEVLGNPSSWIGPGSLALKAGGGVLSAVGSEGLGQLTAGTSLETPARIVGGVAAGAGAGVVSSERGLSKLAGRLPTREDIKAAASAGYDMLKTSNTRISPEGTQALLTDIQGALHADQFRDYLAPTTYRALQELTTGGSATIGDLDGVRRLLGRVPVTNPTDRLAADRAIRAIDDFLINVPEHFVISGNPANDAAILKHAQRNWALHKQLETLELATTKAQRRADVSGTGFNRINTSRQEIRKILDSDKKSRGLSDDVKEKMENIIVGTWATNTSRQLGKFAPSGPVSATTSILTGLGAGPAAGAGVAAGGFLAHYLGEYLTDRQIRQLEQLMRSESPIGRPIAREIAPDIAYQKTVPAAAAARSVLTSPLAAGGL